jgi:hypothetical protein
LANLETWSSEELGDSRPKTDLLREVVGIPLESPRFPVSLSGCEGVPQVSVGILDLDGLLKESEGRKSSA